MREIPVSPVEEKVRRSGAGRCWDTPPCRHCSYTGFPTGCDLLPSHLPWQYRAICLIPETSVPQEHAME